MTDDSTAPKKMDYGKLQKAAEKMLARRSPSLKDLRRKADADNRVAFLVDSASKVGATDTNMETEMGKMRSLFNKTFYGWWL